MKSNFAAFVLLVIEIGETQGEENGLGRNTGARVGLVQEMGNSISLSQGSNKILLYRYA